MYSAIHGGDIYRNETELDFSVNVNPFGIPEKVKSAMHEAIERCEHYPDIENTELISKISKKYRISEENILPGNGASELFAAIVHALRPEKILLPVPSFYGYEKAAEAAEADIIYYKMKEEDGFCLTEDILLELTEDVDLLFLADPNNPVGNVLDDTLLDKICEKCRENNITVVLDECFIEFTKKAGFFERHDLKEYQNVIVVKAFTKLYAIPGVRLGFLFCGNRELTDRIKLHLPEWNISTIAQAAGAAALEEEEYCHRTIEFIEKERAWLKEALSQAGITVYPGEADFLLLRSKRALYSDLLQKKILIRDCRNYKGLTDGYYRIAVKSRQENEKLIAALRELYETGV